MLRLRPRSLVGRRLFALVFRRRNRGKCLGFGQGLSRRRGCFRFGCLASLAGVLDTLFLGLQVFFGDPARLDARGQLQQVAQVGGFVGGEVEEVARRGCRECERRADVRGCSG